MDTQKIGKFLKLLRTQHNMTQEQLGEKLGVTNKTISRWETGNYLPSIDCLKLMSEMYQISINEILSGETLGTDEFKAAAEANITLALKRREKEDKRFENIMTVLVLLTSAIGCALLFLMPDNFDSKIKELAVILMIVGLVFIANTLNIVAMSLKKDKK
ncbi:MAG: helix-turn-helix transcriptional regulator [Oscillospiraceae bacterium]|nr:helix-turn-helix transcriptional regulator [Oscillospiraceae bacterium]